MLYSVAEHTTSVVLLAHNMSYALVLQFPTLLTQPIICKGVKKFEAGARSFNFFRDAGATRTPICTKVSPEVQTAFVADYQSNMWGHRIIAI